MLAIYKPHFAYLRRQLESIRTQTHTDWFVIMRDDRSVEIGELEKLTSEILPRDRYRILQGETRVGAVGNFGAALEAVPRDYDLIAFCDQDDEWEPRKLERIAAEFRDPEVMAVHSDLSLIDGEGLLLNESCWRSEDRDVTGVSAEKLIFRNSVTGCAMMFRSTLLADVLPLPRQPLAQPEFFHDVWVALAALRRGRLVSCSEPLVRYRQHGANVVGSEESRRSISLTRPSALAGKALRAYRSRRELELAWLRRSEAKLRLFSRGFDLGLPILSRTLSWGIFVSRGYLRIGLQLALGKLLWDLRVGRRGETA